MSNKREYIPALRFGFLNFIYDPVVALSCREKVFKSRLLKYASIDQGEPKIIDVGSGTGTLAILSKTQNFRAQVVGLDADPNIIVRAEKKSRAAGVDVTFVNSMSFEMPFAENDFDICISSLFFHHLTKDGKEQTLREAYRILKPGGQIHIADWGKPSGIVMRSVFLLVQIIDGFATTNDSVKGVLPNLLEKSGFVKVTVNQNLNTLLGTISLYSAIKP